MGRILSCVDDRRQFERTELSQICIRISGRIYHSVEWSFGGLVVRDEGCCLPTAALARIDGLSGETDYMNARPLHDVDIRARVVRVMADEGLVALSCLNLNDAAYRILCSVMNGEVMATADQA